MKAALEIPSSLIDQSGKLGFTALKAAERSGENYNRGLAFRFSQEKRDSVTDKRADSLDYSLLKPDWLVFKLPFSFSNRT